MKRLFCLIFSVFILIVFSACSSSAKQQILTFDDFGIYEKDKLILNIKDLENDSPIMLHFNRPPDNLENRDLETKLGVKIGNTVVEFGNAYKNVNLSAAVDGKAEIITGKEFANNFEKYSKTDLTMAAIYARFIDGLYISDDDIEEAYSIKAWELRSDKDFLSEHSLEETSLMFFFDGGFVEDIQITYSSPNRSAKDVPPVEEW